MHALSEKERLRQQILLDMADYTARVGSRPVVTACYQPLAGQHITGAVEEFDFSTKYYKNALESKDYRIIRGGEKVTPPAARGGQRFLDVPHTMVMEPAKFLQAIGHDPIPGLAVRRIMLDGIDPEPVRVHGAGHWIDPYREISLAEKPDLTGEPFYREDLGKLVLNILKNDGGLVALSKVIERVKEISGGRVKNQERNQEIEDYMMDLWMIGHANRYKGVDGLDYFQFV